MQNAPEDLRYVLITGCSTGIGRACALYLATHGFRVIAGVRKIEDAQKLESAGAGSREELKTILLDITDAESIAAARVSVQQICGESGLMGVVNNAGIGVVGPIEFVTIPDWRKQFEVNLFGQIALSQAMLPLLRAQVARRGMGAGRLVFIGSIAGRISQPMMAPYCASKFAIEALCDALRLELRSQGISVSLLEPGAIQSEIWRKGDESVRTFPREAEARPLYGAQMDAVRKVAKESGETAMPAEVVARAVERCLVSARPKTRIVIGRDARMGAILRRILPDRLFDRVILHLLKL